MGAPSTPDPGIRNSTSFNSRIPLQEGRDDRLNEVIVAGSIFPDVPMLFFFIWYTWVVPTSQRTIWGTLYFTEGWQTVFNLFHSVPIFLTLAGVAYWLSRPRLFIFCLAGLLHFMEDFFVHQEDGHAHFFPLSNYKFISPISYWDSRSFGNYFSIAEPLVILACSFYVFRYLKTWWGKTLLVLINGFSFSGHIFWYFVFTHFH